MSFIANTSVASIWVACRWSIGHGYARYRNGFSAKNKQIRRSLVKILCA